MLGLPVHAHLEAARRIIGHAGEQPARTATTSVVPAFSTAATHSWKPMKVASIGSFGTALLGYR